MTPLLLATIFNTVAIALVITISVAVSRRYGAPFFKHWIKAHVWEFILLASEWPAAAGVAHFAAYTALQAALVFMAGWYLLQTTLTLVGREQPAGRMWIGLGVTVAYALALRAAGVSHFATVALPLLGVLLVLIWQGVVFITDKRFRHTGASWWIGVPQLFRGVGAIAISILGGTAYEFASYSLGAWLHAMAGIGMIMFLVNEATDALEQRNRDLAALEKMKGDLLNVVGHELRTPLAVIAQATHALKAPDEDLRAEMIAIVTSKVGEMTTMVSGLLDLAQLEAGLFRADMDTDDLGLALDEALRDLELVAQTTGHRLEIDFTDDALPATHDRRLVRQVLTNLVTNAFKYTPPGSAITVRIWAEGSRARIAVVDHGPGIPAADRESVFGAFKQLEDSRTRRQGGLGIGLPLCKRVVTDIHGGRIWVEETPGGGTTVQVTLPLEAQAPALIAA